MEAVIDTYQTPLLRYAAHLLNHATLAQDAVQNALVKLFRQWQAGITGPTISFFRKSRQFAVFAEMFTY